MKIRMSSGTEPRVVRRLAALYDIHGNLPGLEAVLAEVEREQPDLVVVGGDVVSGPMPRETLERLCALAVPVRWVMGNGDRLALAAARSRLTLARAEGEAERADAWAAERLTPDQLELIAAFETVVEVEVEQLGAVLFCHGSPRSDEEKLTARTPPERLAGALAGVAAQTVVCGHTHVQFDRMSDTKRVVNAGSVGMPYEGRPGAFWLRLGPGVRLRETGLDVAAAAEAILATGYPDAQELVRNSLTEPVDPDWVARYFEGETEEAPD
jgi:putative phosphoesterase